MGYKIGEKNNELQFFQISTLEVISAQKFTFALEFTHKGPKWVISIPKFCFFVDNFWTRTKYSDCYNLWAKATAAPALP